MSATSQTFQVTDTASGTTSDISAIDIVLVTASGSGSKINYMKDGATPVQLIVTESPSTVSTASKYLIPLTATATSTIFYVNIDNIRNVFTNGSAANVQYDMKTAQDVVFAVNETRSAIRILIAGIVSSGGGGSVTPGLIAHAGGGQSSATQLSYGFNQISTVATALDSVKLPAGIIGAVVNLINNGANIANVYPATSGTINSGGANSPIPLAPGAELNFENIDGTNWQTTLQTIAAPDGTASLPSFTFEADNDTGFYRVSANTIGLALGGVEVAQLNPTQLSWLVGNLSAQGDVYGTNFIPSGIITNTAGAVGAPSYTFTGQTNLGFYKVSATQMGVTVGGVLVAMFDAAGVVTAKVNEQVVNDGVYVDAVKCFDGFVVSNPTPVAINVTAVATGAQIASGYITSTSAAAVAITTPTAAAIAAALPVTPTQGMHFDFYIDNSGGANTVTLTLDASITVNTPAITGGDTLTVSTANSIGGFRLVYVSATAAKIFRLL